MHGIGMVFFFIMPLLISFAGNWGLPQETMTWDFGAPRLNLLALVLLVISVELLIIAICREESLGAGWTLYPPLVDTGASVSDCIQLVIIVLHILGISSQGGSITFISSLLCSRYSGWSFTQQGLFNWCIFITSILLIDALPVLGAAITLLFTDRSANTCIYSGYSNGDPLIWQHLFWYFGHPEVYIIVLPAFGIVSWVLGRELSRSLPPHLGMLCATLSLAGIGFFVWAHHMFVAGISSESRVYFSAATMIIAIPTALKLLSWLSSALGFSVWSATISVFSAFLTFFISGGLTGLILSNLGIDIVYHDTYFVVGHFHYVLSIASSIAVLIVARLFIGSLVTVPADLPSKIQLVVIVTALNLLFGPLHVLGVEVHPRRITSAPESTTSIQQVSNGAVLVLVAFSIMFVSSPGSRTNHT